MSPAKAPFHMADDDATDGRKTGGRLHVNVDAQNSTPDSAWITRPVSHSVTEAIDKAPMGAVYELTYAVLAKRLRDMLDPTQAEVHGLMIDSLVHSAINFRSLNPNFYTGGGRVPTVPQNSGAGAGAYHSSIWGVNKDERLPETKPLTTPDQPYAMGQDPTPEQNKGLLIAKLFNDLQHHLPLVLFNVTNKRYIPIGIGGSSASRRFYKDGKSVTELAYRVELSVEATAVTEDDESTSNLQAIIEAAFGTLRDHLGTGSAITGSSWQLWLPTNVTPSPITEIDSPWSQGDDKGSKLYTGTVGLEQMQFEAIAYVGKPVTALIANDSPDVNRGLPSITLATESSSATEPLQLKLGMPQRLVLHNTPVTTDLVVSQSKRVIELRKPFHGSGVYEIIPRRTGEANLFLYETGMVVSATGPNKPSARVGEPLVQRKVVVTAV